MAYFWTDVSILTSSFLFISCSVSEIPWSNLPIDGGVLIPTNYYNIGYLRKWLGVMLMELKIISMFINLLDRRF